MTGFAHSTAHVLSFLSDAPLHATGAADEKMEGEVGIGTEPRETGPEPQTSEACEPARKRTKLSKYRGVETHDGGSTWHTVVKVQGTEKEASDTSASCHATRLHSDQREASQLTCSCIE